MPKPFPEINKTIKKTARSQDLLQKVGSSPFSSLPRSTSLPLPQSDLNSEQNTITSVKGGNSVFSSLSRSTSLPRPTDPKSKINFEIHDVTSVTPLQSITKSAHSSPLMKLADFNPANIRLRGKFPTEEQVQGTDGAKKLNIPKNLSAKVSQQLSSLEFTHESIEYYPTSLINQIINLPGDNQSNTTTDDGTLKLNTNEHSTTE